jgi:hypothetical protein
MVQLELAATDEPQVLVWLYSEASAPVIEIVTAKLKLAALLKVAFIGVLESPTVMAPNAKVAGVSLT